MADQSVAFHLRTNKSIERALFVELLIRVGLGFSLRDYVYISMGGDFLQDHALVHKRLGISNLLSIDDTAWRVERQKYNRNVCCIDCEQMDDEELVENFYTIAGRYGEGKRFIVWLDYMRPKDRGVQLRQVDALVPKLSHGDVLKITLNANVESIGSAHATTPEERAHERYVRLLGQLNDYFPDGYDENAVETRFIELLGEAVKKACTAHVARRHVFYPLSAFVYSDQTQMATYTGIVLHESEKERFLSDTRISTWDFYTSSFAAPHRINVPQLSTREKTEIDRMIGRFTGVDIQRKLGVSLAEDAAATADIIDQYEKYYRFYPQYVQALL